MKTFTHERDEYEEEMSAIDKAISTYVRETIIRWCRLNGVNPDMILRDYNENI